jgi:hypothetical protein
MAMGHQKVAHADPDCFIGKTDNISAFNLFNG